MNHFGIAIVLAAVTMSISACDRKAPALSRAEVDELRADLPGMTDACAARIGRDGIRAFPTETDQCFTMGDAQVFRGLLSRSFEQSLFCQLPATDCPGGMPENWVWLAFGNRGEAERISRDSGLYEIEFLGRQTAERGAHGHLGMAPHEVIVDELISMKPIRKYEEQ